MRKSAKNKKLKNGIGISITGKSFCLLLDVIGLVLGSNGRKSKLFAPFGCRLVAIATVVALVQYNMKAHESVSLLLRPSVLY